MEKKEISSLPSQETSHTPRMDAGGDPVPNASAAADPSLGGKNAADLQGIGFLQWIKKRFTKATDREGSALKKLGGRTFRNVMKLNEIDSAAMALLYILHLLSEIGYMYVIWGMGFDWGDGLSFLLCYSFLYGVALMVDVMLLRAVFSTRRMIWTRLCLRIAAGVQALEIMTDVVYTVYYGDFWRDGYLYLVLEAVMIVMYVRRMLILRQFETLVTEEVRSVPQSKEVNMGHER